MRKNSTMKNRTATSLTRGRAAVVTGGVVAALALGSTAAFAAGGAQHEGFLAAGSTGSAARAVQHQAAGQHAVAAAEAKAAVAKATAAKTAARKAADDARKQAASWVTPTTGYVLGAHFNQAGAHWIHKHSGQDFVVPTGTKVRAAHAGTVVEADWGGAYGNNIVIRHGGHLYTQYGHLSKFLVHVGDRVNTGQTIALSGSTGNSTGPHLHFEVRLSGNPVDPTSYLS
jgi:murein DD-endopeptidase MepM/ murein hydrolase activator NlpD